MNKMYVLMKVEYGDFDMPFNTPIFVSRDKELLEAKKAECMGQRNEKQIDDCLHYHIHENKVKVL